MCKILMFCVCVCVLSEREGSPKFVVTLDNVERELLDKPINFESDADLELEEQVAVGVPSQLPMELETYRGAAGVPAHRPRVRLPSLLEVGGGLWGGKGESMTSLLHQVVHVEPAAERQDSTGGALLFDSDGGYRCRAPPGGATIALCSCSVLNVAMQYFFACSFVQKAGPLGYLPCKIHIKDMFMLGCECKLLALYVVSESYVLMAVRGVNVLQRRW